LHCDGCKLNGDLLIRRRTQKQSVSVCGVLRCFLLIIAAEMEQGHDRSSFLKSYT
jgi:hypothetical protein